METNNFLTFGSIFTYDDKTYVYLGNSPSGETTYAALVIPKHSGRQLVDNMNEQIRRNGTESISGNTVFMFVMLTSPGFQDDLAHLRGSEHDSNMREERMLISDKVLNGEDCVQIAECILDNASYVPSFLKEIVAELGITAED